MQPPEQKQMQWYFRRYAAPYHACQAMHASYAQLA